MVIPPSITTQLISGLGNEWVGAAITSINAQTERAKEPRREAMVR
jgi:hypothetical protein